MRPLLRLARAAGVYGALTVVLTWPLARELRVMEPGDSAYFAWVMAWEIHALKTDPASLPHANIFYPARYALGFDEPVLGTMVLVFPFSFFTHDAVLLYNLARLLTFLLSGFTAYLLARELGCREGPALLAGALFAFSPIRTDHLSHLSVLGTQWLPLVPLYLVRFSRNGRVRNAFLAALFFVLTAYACGYHGVLGLLILPLAALPLLVGRWRRLAGAFLAAAFAALALLPLQILHERAFREARFARTEAETVFYSASLESFLATGSGNRVWGELTAPFRTEGSNNLFPGAVVPALVLAGVVLLLLRRRRPSREAVALGVLVVAAALVALGPEVRWEGRVLGPGPYLWVRRAVPLFQGVRVMSRAGVYLALGLTALAGLAVDRLELGRRWLILLAVAALSETLVSIETPRWFQVIDSSVPPPKVYTWLAAQPGEFALVELPMLPSDGRFRDPAHEETIYMVWSTLHWKRLLNGDAGVEPARHRKLRELLRGFPSRASLEALEAVGTRYVVLHGGGYGPNKWRRIQRDLPRFAACLRRAAGFGDDTVYEILEAPGCPLEPAPPAVVP